MVARAAVAVAIALTWIEGGCRSRSPVTTHRAGSQAAVPAPPPANPAPVTSEACRACRGHWGAHGLDDKESCNCRTTDAGKRCLDGADCQGICIASKDDPQTEVSTPGPPARGFFVGRCSDFVTVFGCNRVIERGANARGPVPLDAPPQVICVD